MGNILKHIPGDWFYLLIYILGILSAGQFVATGAFQNNAFIIGIGVVFIVMATGGMMLLNNKSAGWLLEKLGFASSSGGDSSSGKRGPGGRRSSFSVNLHSFWIFGMFAVLISFLGSAAKFSLLSIPRNQLLSTATQGLSIADQANADILMAPFNETFIFVAHAIFAGIFTLILAKGLNLGERTWKFIFFVTYISFSSITFFAFHVGMAGDIAFLGAIVFYRAIMGLATVGDKFWDILPWLTVAFSAEIGYHLFNNLYTYGFNGILILLSGGITSIAFWCVISLLVLGVLEIYNIIRLKAT